MFTCIHVYMCTCIYVYVYVCTHNHIHTISPQAVSRGSSVRGAAVAITIVVPSE